MEGTPTCVLGRDTVRYSNGVVEVVSGRIGEVSFDADGEMRPRPHAIVRLSRHADSLNRVLPGRQQPGDMIWP
jgi:hypothetical protein